MEELQPAPEEVEPEEEDDEHADEVPKTKEETKSETKEDHTCCSACQLAKGRTGRKKGCFSKLKSLSQRRARVAPRLEGMHTGTGEALMLLRRLHREYPETQMASTVSNLSLLNLIRVIGLTFNKLVDMRFWLMDEMRKGTDLSTIPTARKIMAAGYAATLPQGMPPMGDMAASVPLQSLLNKTTERLLATTEVSEILQDGATYEFLLKSGNDGQSGRGTYSHKPVKGVKKVNDDKM